MNKLSVETVQAVATLWNARLPMRDIMDATGRTEASIRKMVTTHKALFAHRSGADYGERLNEAETLWRDGVSLRQIGETLGMTEKAVKTMVCKNRARFPYRLVRGNQKPIARAKPKVSPAVPTRPKGKPVASPVRTAFEPGIDVLAKRVSGDAEPGGQPIGLVELTATTCRWPVTGERAATLFCGCRIEPGKIYCAPHRVRSTAGGGAR